MVQQQAKVCHGPLACNWHCLISCLCTANCSTVAPDNMQTACGHESHWQQAIPACVICQCSSAAQGWALQRFLLPLHTRYQTKVLYYDSVALHWPSANSGSSLSTLCAPLPYSHFLLLATGNTRSSDYYTYRTEASEYQNAPIDSRSMSWRDVPRQAYKWLTQSTTSVERDTTDQNKLRQASYYRSEADGPPAPPSIPAGHVSSARHLHYDAATTHGSAMDASRRLSDGSYSEGER